MRAKMSASVLFLLGLMVFGLVACGTDSGVAASQADEAIGDVQNVQIADETHDDDDGHADVVADEHDDGDGKTNLVSDTHEDDAAEADGHGHGTAGAVDPDAPVMHVSAVEFGYETATSEVEAGRPFTVQIRNDGMLEHDITFAGLEDKGGVHVQPGEEGIATFSIDEPGEYLYYCTVSGHREAGMTGTLIVSDAQLTILDTHDDHDEAEHEDVYDEDAAHDDETHDGDAASDA